MFRVMGKITKRLFPTGSETPSEISRSVVKKAKRKPAPQDVAYPDRSKKKGK